MQADAVSPNRGLRRARFAPSPVLSASSCSDVPSGVAHDAAQRTLHPSEFQVDTGALASERPPDVADIFKTADTALSPSAQPLVPREACHTAEAVRDVDASGPQCLDSSHLGAELSPELWKRAKVKVSAVVALQGTRPLADVKHQLWTVNKAQARSCQQWEEVKRAVHKPRTSLWEISAAREHPHLSKALSRVHMDARKELGEGFDQVYEVTDREMSFREQQDAREYARHEIQSTLNNYNGDFKALRATVARAEKHNVAEVDLELARDKLAEERSLFLLMDHTSTPFGFKLLRKWVSESRRRNTMEIQERHEAVQYFSEQAVVAQSLRNGLREALRIPRSRTEGTIGHEWRSVGKRTWMEKHIDLEAATQHISEWSLQDLTEDHFFKLEFVTMAFSKCFRLVRDKLDGTPLPSRLEKLSNTGDRLEDSRHTFPRLCRLSKVLESIIRAIRHVQDGTQVCQLDNVYTELSQYDSVQNKINNMHIAFEFRRADISRQLEQEGIFVKLDLWPSDSTHHREIEAETHDPDVADALKLWIRRRHPDMLLTANPRTGVRFQTRGITETLDELVKYESLLEQKRHRLFTRLVVDFRAHKDEFLAATRFLAEMDVLLSLAVVSRGLVGKEVIELGEEDEDTGILELPPEFAQGGGPRAVHKLRAAQPDLTEQQRMQKAMDLVSACVAELTGGAQLAGETYQDTRGLEVQPLDTVLIHGTGTQHRYTKMEQIDAFHWQDGSSVALQAIDDDPDHSSGIVVLPSDKTGLWSNGDCFTLRRQTAFGNENVLGLKVINKIEVVPSKQTRFFWTEAGANAEIKDGTGHDAFSDFARRSQAEVSEAQFARLVSAEKVVDDMLKIGWISCSGPLYWTAAGVAWASATETASAAKRVAKANVSDNPLSTKHNAKVSDEQLGTMLRWVDALHYVRGRQVSVLEEKGYTIEDLLSQGMASRGADGAVRWTQTGFAWALEIGVLGLRESRLAELQNRVAVISYLIDEGFASRDTICCWTERGFAWASENSILECNEAHVGRLQTQGVAMEYLHDNGFVTTVVDEVCCWTRQGLEWAAQNRILEVDAASSRRCAAQGQSIQDLCDQGFVAEGDGTTGSWTQRGMSWASKNLVLEIGGPEMRRLTAQGTTVAELLLQGLASEERQTFVCWTHSGVAWAAKLEAAAARSRTVYAPVFAQDLPTGTLQEALQSGYVSAERRTVLNCCGHGPVEAKGKDATNHVRQKGRLVQDLDVRNVWIFKRESMQYNGKKGVCLHRAEPWEKYAGRWIVKLDDDISSVTHGSDASVGKVRGADRAARGVAVLPVNLSKIETVTCVCGKRNAAGAEKCKFCQARLPEVHTPRRGRSIARGKQQHVNVPFWWDSC